MCGRTSLAVPTDVFSRRFDAEPRSGVEISEWYNTGPGEDLVAVQNDAPEEFDMLKWGFIPEWANNPYDVFLGGRSMF
ncbi:SOS response-associated peptidase family protein [Halobaculum sp. D14]|uniref:SOS response-associated peptidase family protein n=1 Tax=Halobaculum sp. D14 TaxID=3421642 RepID=UPI003EBB7E12